MEKEKKLKLVLYAAAIGSLGVSFALTKGLDNMETKIAKHYFETTAYNDEYEYIEPMVIVNKDGSKEYVAPEGYELTIVDKNGKARLLAYRAKEKTR